MLCSLTSECKTKKIEKKKVQLVEDVKQPSENGNTFFLFTKNTWIRNSGASCHITKDDNGMYISSTSMFNPK